MQMDTSILELAWALGPYAICGEGNVSVRDDDSFLDEGKWFFINQSWKKRDGCM